MIITTLKLISNENNMNLIDEKLTLLQGLLGGDIKAWFEGKNFYENWNQMSFRERMKELQNYMNIMVNITAYSDIDDAIEKENKIYDLEILVLEWNKYEISLKASSLENAKRIAQSNGANIHNDESIMYNYNLVEAAVKRHNEDGTDIVIIDDARER